MYFLDCVKGKLCVKLTKFLPKCGIPGKSYVFVPGALHQDLL